jgi:hypothetical protein
MPTAWRWLTILEIPRTVRRKCNGPPPPDTPALGIRRSLTIGRRANSARSTCSWLLDRRLADDTPLRPGPCAHAQL